MSWRLCDMHCHLDSFDDPQGTADALAERGISTLAVTVTPRRFELSSELGMKPGVRLAAGMHPWYFEEDIARINIEKAVALAGHERFIGEVGLDFFERHAPRSTWNVQRATLMRILDACAASSVADSPTVISLHSVRAAGAVLDLLETSGAARRCACIFHWFSDSTDELWRAIKLGCWFSCNEKMMEVKRSREYAKLIPAERLLLETDYPPPSPWKTPDEWAADIERSLLAAASALADARSATPEEICALTTSNALPLLGL